MGYRSFVQKVAYTSIYSMSCFRMERNIFVYIILYDARKNMDCVAIETLRTQILDRLLRDLVATYKKEPTNTEKIEYIKRHIMTVSGKSEKNYNDSKN